MDPDDPEPGPATPPSPATIPSRAELALAPEIMDGPLPYAEARRALLDLDRVNRVLLGVTAARRALIPRFRASAGAAGAEVSGRALRVLDLGAGSGRIARLLTGAARRRGVPVRMVVVDRRLTHLAVGRAEAGGSRRERAPLAVAASADALPFRDGAFDWTFSNLFFHHFDGAENRAVLAGMLRCARAGAVVIDLRRSGFAAFLIRLFFPLLGIGRVALHDGLLSLAQSWTLDEVRAEVEELVRREPSFRSLELRRRFPFRWSLVVSKDHRGP